MKTPTVFFLALLFTLASALGEEQSNLLSNPGFEEAEAGKQMPSGWKVVRGSPGLVKEGGHSGDSFIRMVDGGPKASLYLESQRLTARPGGKYRAAAWMRTGDKGGPGVYINFFNGQGTRIHNVNARAAGPTSGWVRVEVEAVAPASAETVAVSLYSFAGDQGTFDFDDVELYVAGGRDPFEGRRLKGKVKEVADIGSRRELFVDRYLIDRMEGARLVLNHPRDAGESFKLDRPWEGLFCGYFTIVKYEKGFRAYYRSRPKAGKDGDDSETTSVAESKDGIVWTKPKLGLYEIDGSRDNNVVLKNMTPYSHNFSPWLDSRPGVEKNQRFKALAGLYPEGLALLVSADGLTWKVHRKGVITSKEFAFDSQACAFWSEAEEQYVCYFRSWKDKVRWISRTTSKDAVTWTEPVKMDFGDAPPEHLYTNQTQPYFRAPHLYLSTAARFMPGRQVLTEQQAKEINVDPKYFKDTSDSVLITSRGGDRYERTFMTSYIPPGIGARNWVSRTNYPAWNIVQTGPAEMSIYVHKDYAQPTGHLQRYSMRLDGFASVRSEYSGGELLTRPLTFSGKHLEINFATSAAGSVRVEIQTADGVPVPGFAAIDCREQIGNEIERTVTWREGDDLSELAGKPVRLRFVMRDADLYALKFSN